MSTLIAIVLAKLITLRPKLALWLVLAGMVSATVTGFLYGNR